MGQLIEYETPQISVRGVFFVENMALVQSPVKGVTLEAWTEETVEITHDPEEGLMPLW
jgi:hypothetical protein